MFSLTVLSMNVHLSPIGCVAVLDIVPEVLALKALLTFPSKPNNSISSSGSTENISSLILGTVCLIDYLPGIVTLIPPP